MSHYDFRELEKIANELQHMSSAGRFSRIIYIKSHASQIRNLRSRFDDAVRLFEVYVAGQFTVHLV